MVCMEQFLCLVPKLEIFLIVPKLLKNCAGSDMFSYLQVHKLEFVWGGMHRGNILVGSLGWGLDGGD